MCSGVFFILKGEQFRIYFPNPKAVLPILRKDGSIDLIPWGRRKGQAGALPIGGWANLDAVYTGYWDEWFPRPVKLPISSFMETDFQGGSNWYDVTKGKYLQGLVARDGKELRVYVVTIVPERSDALHERWPRIVSG